MDDQELSQGHSGASSPAGTQFDHGHPKYIATASFRIDGTLLGMSVASRIDDPYLRSAVVENCLSWSAHQVVRSSRSYSAETLSLMTLLTARPESRSSAERLSEFVRRNVWYTYFTYRMSTTGRAVDTKAHPRQSDR